MADMTELLAISTRAGVPLIEDAAQAHGARRAGRAAGAVGTVGCFSFYPTKNLGAIGDAGAVVTDDAALAERLRRLRQYGWLDKYETGLAGGRNSRLDELQAAVLRDRLPHLDEWNRQRTRIARRYLEGLRGAPIRSPAWADSEYVAHLFVIEAPDRDGLARHLAQRGIGTAIHYPVGDHRQPAYAASLGPLELPVTERLADHVLSLPCFPGMTMQEQVEVVRGVLDFHGITRGEAEIEEAMRCCP
jgi:aminotransferase EvaB